LTRLIAPILPVTADQLWHSLPGDREESVHIGFFPEQKEIEGFKDEELAERWKRLIEVRDLVLAEIEPLRKSKQIGSSLQAKVVLSATKPDLSLLERHRRDLPMLFIVSEVELRPAPSGATGSGGPQPVVSVTIERAGGVKCERCWRYVPRVSSDPAWAGLCDRCLEALTDGGGNGLPPTARPQAV